MTYTVRYYAGPYSGNRTVNASDEEEAIEKVRGQIRREMTLPMYSDGYKIVSSSEDRRDNEEED